MRTLPIAAVMDRTGLARRTIYQEMAAGRFPKPLQLTQRRTGWIEAEIEAWLQARLDARDAGGRAA